MTFLEDLTELVGFDNINHDIRYDKEEVYAINTIVTIHKGHFFSITIGGCSYTYPRFERLGTTVEEAYASLFSIEIWEFEDNKAIGLPRGWVSYEEVLAIITERL
jgi:hypothetical protein